MSFLWRGKPLQSFGNRKSQIFVFVMVLFTLLIPFVGLLNEGRKQAVFTE
jgi:hypothetical protein